MHSTPCDANPSAASLAFLSVATKRFLNNGGDTSGMTTGAITPTVKLDSATLHRKKLLREYIAKNGGNNAVARTAGMSTGRISQLASDAYPIGPGAFARLADKLMLPTYFFDGETTDVTDAPVGRKVPVVSWEAAGEQSPQEIGHEIAHSNAHFALRMNNDSMASTSPSVAGLAVGMTLFVNRELQAQEGDLVIARLPGATSATCRKLVFDSGFQYLQPVNPAYQMVKVTEQVELLGVVVEARMAFRQS